MAELPGVRPASVRPPAYGLACDELLDEDEDGRKLTVVPELSLLLALLLLLRLPPRRPRASASATTANKAANTRTRHAPGRMANQSDGTLISLSSSPCLL
ncbi:hypothetical protein GCM10027034_22780 [Ramlibacter solisilvae]